MIQKNPVSVNRKASRIIGIRKAFLAVFFLPGPAFWLIISDDRLRYGGVGHIGETGKNRR
jgi:hypothetical protein